jgi:hypothetical protein
MTMREVARAIREHNKIHQQKEPQAVFISNYLELAADIFDAYAAEGEFVSIDNDISDAELVDWLDNHLNENDYMQTACSLNNDFHMIPKTTQVLRVLPPAPWIKCSEQLPRSDKKVLIYGTFKYRTIAIYAPNEQTFIDMHGIRFSMNEVTHWCPVPEVPQED